MISVVRQTGMNVNFQLHVFKLARRQIRVLSFCCVLLVFGCRRAESLEKPTTKQIEAYSRLMSLTFPPECEVVGAKHRVGLDDIIFLKLKLPHDNVETFLEHSPFKGAALSESESFVTAEKYAHLDSWDVDSIREFRSGRVELPNAKTLHVLTDADQSEYSIVYLEYREY